MNAKNTDQNVPLELPDCTPSGLVHPFSARHGAFDWNVNQLRWILMERVAPEHDQIRKLARLNRTLVALFVGSVRPVASSHPDGSRYTSARRRTPPGAVHVRASNLPLQSHHCKKFTRPIARTSSRPHTR